MKKLPVKLNSLKLLVRETDTQDLVFLDPKSPVHTWLSPTQFISTIYTRMAQFVDGPSEL